MTPPGETPRSSAALLIHEQDEDSIQAILRRAGRILLPGVQEMLASYGIPASALRAEPGERVDPRDMGDVVFAEYRFGAAGAYAQLAFPLSLFIDLADRHYGGTGELAGEPQRSHFGNAERRLFARVIARLLPRINAVFAIAPLQEAQETLSGTDFTESKLGRTSSMLYRLDFVAGEESRLIMRLICHPALIEIVAKQASPPEVEVAPVAHSPWQQHLHDAVMQVHLPLRTIFARPEVPLSRLLQLKAGDIIPICMPARVPLTVAGKIFGEGCVGEANGMAAVCIEQLESERTNV